MRWILYGATGYTGVLLAERAAQRGLKPILAGRSEAKLAPLAQRLGLEHRAVSLDDAAGLRKLLEGADAVLHVAGPFVDTSAPMVKACLDTGTHYLDITGELPVFERLYAMDPQAKERKISIIPGVGFDVVPTDCLARYVAEKVPGASELEIALAAIANPSAGTAKSALGIYALGGMARREGRLVSQPLGRGLKRVRFTSRERWVVPGPIADLASAYRTTGIPDITVYMAVGRQTAQMLRFIWPATTVTIPLMRAALKVNPVERALRSLIEKRTVGADAATRAKGRSYVWARAAAGGRVAEAWLETIEAYDFTQEIALRAVERVLADRPVGALTPAQAFGADFVMEVAGTVRKDRLD